MFELWIDLLCLVGGAPEAYGSCPVCVCVCACVCVSRACFSATAKRLALETST